MFYMKFRRHRCVIAALKTEFCWWCLHFAKKSLHVNQRCSTVPTTYRIIQ